MTLLDKEPVRRVGRIIREFDQNLSVCVLETSARTALEAASSLGCEVGAVSYTHLTLPTILLV